MTLSKEMQAIKDEVETEKKPLDMNALIGLYAEINDIDEQNDQMKADQAANNKIIKQKYKDFLEEYESDEDSLKTGYKVFHKAMAESDMAAAAEAGNNIEEVMSLVNAALANDKVISSAVQDAMHKAADEAEAKRRASL